MSKLIELLKEQTVSLKEQYVEKTIEWATKDFNRYMEMSKWKEADWAKYLGVETRIANPGTTMEFITFHSGFYNTKASREYSRKKDEIYRVKRMGKDEYILNARRKAENHYEYSIIKLADRISKKGLNEDNLRMTTSHIGMNIETTITDGVKTIRAFTILAWGEIQCPHYRYLVK